MEYWDSAKDKVPNVQLIQSFQNKLLICIGNVFSYVRNSDLRRYLDFQAGADIISIFASSHHSTLENHTKFKSPLFVKGKYYWTI